jgi:hypothetical protein
MHNRNESRRSFKMYSETRERKPDRALVALQGVQVIYNERIDIVYSLTEGGDDTGFKFKKARYRLTKSGRLAG